MLAHMISILSSSMYICIYNIYGVALYLQHLGEKLESKSAVGEVVNVLNWVHSLAGVQSPTHSPLVQATTENLGRLLVRPVQKKTTYQVTFCQRLSRKLRQSHCQLFSWLLFVFWHSLDFCVVMSCSSVDRVTSRSHRR